MGNDDFLKKLQDSLNKGEKNEEITDYLNEINEKAELLKNPIVDIDDRLEKSGLAEAIDEEKRDDLEKEYQEILSEQQKNDEKLRFLANIEQCNVEITKLKSDFNEVKRKYSEQIQKIQDQKIMLMGEFEKKYGKKAEDEYNFGTEPNTEIE